MAAIAAIKVSSICGSTIRTTDAAIAEDATFTPAGFVAPGVAKYEEQSGSVPLLWPSVTLGVRRPNKTSRIYRVTGKITLPTPDTIGNAYNGITPGPSIAYSNQVILDFLLPERGTTAERLKLLNYLISLLMVTINASDDVPSTATATPFRTAVVGLDQPY